MAEKPVLYYWDIKGKGYVRRIFNVLSTCSRPHARVPVACCCGVWMCLCVSTLCAIHFFADLMHATHATPHSPHRDQVPRLLMAAAGIEYQVRF
jgi:hypothetical protein